MHYQLGCFKNKTAIVTGGASGLGAAICQQLAENGAEVVIADLEYDKAQALANYIVQRGGKAWAEAVDVSNEDSVRKLVDASTQNSSSGKIDFYFNNAGIGVIGEIHRFSIKQFEKVIQINLLGTIYGTYYAYQQFLKQGSGHIVNISSGFGLMPSAINAPYAISKAGIIRFSESLLVEAADHGIAVTVICPGSIKTPFFQKTPVIGSTMDSMIEQTNFKMIDAEKAASIILQKVAKKQFLVIFPSYVKLLYWLSKLMPSLMLRLNLKFVRDFRKKPQE